jgi:hypothetical protein
MMPTLTDAEQLAIAITVYDSLPEAKQDTWCRARRLHVDPDGRLRVTTGPSHRTRVNSGRSRGERLTAEETARMTHLLDTGHRPLHVAIEVGVSSTCVYRFIAKRNNPIRKAS